MPNTAPIEAGWELWSPAGGRWADTGTFTWIEVEDLGGAYVKHIDSQRVHHWERSHWVASEGPVASLPGYSQLWMFDVS